ncbi:MAG: hypothetical protein ACM3O3_01610 [Syntrophothermus sp.]
MKIELHYDFNNPSPENIIVQGEILNELQEFGIVYKVLSPDSKISADHIILEKLKTLTIFSLEEGFYLVPCIVTFTKNVTKICIALININNKNIGFINIYTVTNDIGLVNINNADCDFFEFQTFLPNPLFAKFLLEENECLNLKEIYKTRQNALYNEAHYQESIYAAGTTFKYSAEFELPPYAINLNTKLFHITKKDENGNDSEDFMKSFDVNDKINNDIVNGWHYVRLCINKDSHYLGMVKYHPNGFIYDIYINTYSGGISLINQTDELKSNYGLPLISSIDIEFLTLKIEDDSFEVIYSPFATLFNLNLDQYNQMIKQNN